ncbi:MAG: winged helix-turn-helix domain-containing protein, partial [Treponema sp.]|nr:winged helix-turn-helix domain-containing protein [Treponema sp.]
MDTGKFKNKSYRDLQIEGRNTASIVKALSNEIRIQILELLDKQEMNIQSIQKQINLSKTTVLMHLKILEKAGFISTHYVPGTV